MMQEVFWKEKGEAMEGTGMAGKVREDKGSDQRKNGNEKYVRNTE